MGIAVWVLLGLTILCAGLAVLAVNLDRQTLEAQIARHQRERDDARAERDLALNKLQAEELLLRRLRHFIEQGQKP